MDPENVPREEFKEWAQGNNFGIVKDGEHETIVLTEDTEGSIEIMLTKYGNVHLTRHKHLSGEAGELEFSEKQLTVTNARGKEYRISPGRYPI